MTALHLAPAGRVVLATKQRLEDCNTNFAQGGICCVADPADTFAAHVQDTLVAGAGLCDEAVVRRIVSEAPAGIRDLIDCGVRFARKDDGTWDLGREGGHSMRRIFHAGDITGQKCEAAMIRTLKRHPAIDVRERTMVIELITTRRLGLPGHSRCVGAYVLDTETGEIYAVRAPNTVLATGGCGKVYLYTCNPDIATGDGVALAWRAGARIANMEFVQFHPTCLYHPKAKRFLISEAVRPVEARACGLANGREARQRGASVHGRLHAAAAVVGRGDDRDEVLRHVDAERKAGLVDVGEALL